MTIRPGFGRVGRAKRVIHNDRQPREAAFLCAATSRADGSDDSLHKEEGSIGVQEATACPPRAGFLTVKIPEHFFESNDFCDLLNMGILNDH